MKNNDLKLVLNGTELSLQEWIKCINISQVKYSQNIYKKSNKTKIFRSLKHYSLLH